MACDLRCPNCYDNLGKDKENPRLAYCGNCGEDNIKNTRLNKVDVHLHKAAELFDEIGFEKEAKVIRLLLKKKLMKPQKA